MYLKHESKQATLEQLLQWYNSAPSPQDIRSVQHKYPKLMLAWSELCKINL